MSESTRPKRIKIAPNLYKVGDKYYYRRGDDEKLLGQFRTDALAIKAKDAHEALRGALGAEAFRLRLKQVFPDYRQYREAQMEGLIKGRKKISPGTFKEIVTIWDLHLVRFFGNKHLAEIDAPLWEQYCAKATVGDLKNHRKVLVGILGWCAKKGAVRYVPKFEVPHVVPRKRVILTPDQIKALFSNARGNAVLFIAMYLFMGVRRGEQVHLKWSDINFEKRALYVRDETTRTRKGRPVPLNAFVHDLLVERLKAQRTEGIRTPYVYPMRGNPKRHMRHDGIASVWHTTLRHAGLEGIIEPHDLRATYETYANKRGEFTDMQREKMAGASIRTQSQRYVTFDADDVRGLEQVVQFDGLESTLKESKKHASTRKRHGIETGRKSKQDSVDIGKADE